MIRTLTALSLAVFLTACSNFPYRIDVDQGNVIDQQALSQLHVGMTKNQVQQVLGSSLLTDIFHSNRWDYVQYYKRGTTQSVEESKVSLYFTNGLLSRIENEQYNAIETDPVPYSVDK